ncbi:major tail protein [Bilifractor sp. LCP21S3_A7]|uniref:major tail protein n=1 Tax=Bilifractor sp. LCP21S3_A7 TaxID=3438738 RepID=UPI003F90F2AF
MANIGLRKPFFAPFKSTGSGYDAPTALGQAVSVKISVNKAEGELYGDDVMVESDSEFSSATIDLGVTTIPIAFHQSMFGHTITEQETSYSVNDTPPEGGFGIIGVEKVDGKRKYVANFFPRTKFSEPDSEYETKSGSISYKTPSISGKAMADTTGVWKKDKICETEEDAIKWINTQFGVTSGS